MQVNYHDWRIEKTSDAIRSVCAFAPFPNSNKINFNYFNGLKRPNNDINKKKNDNNEEKKLNNFTKIKRFLDAGCSAHSIVVHFFSRHHVY